MIYEWRLVHINYKRVYLLLKADGVMEYITGTITVGGRKSYAARRYKHGRFNVIGRYERLSDAKAHLFAVVRMAS